MKQARSALFFLCLAALAAGSFVFGRYVSSSATMPLRAEHILASQPASHAGWQVEAQNTSSTHELTVPVGYNTGWEKSAQANPDTDEDTSGSDIFSSNSPLVTFQQVYELLKQNYVDKIDDDTPLAHGAVSAMIASLDDPNSRFLEPDARAAIDGQEKGQFSGAGIVFTVRRKVVQDLIERQLTVIDAVAGSPAQAAGIKTGDVITDIDGHWVISFDPFVAQEKLFKSLQSDPVSFNHEVDTIDAKIKGGYDLPKAQAILNATSATPLDLSILRDGHPLKVTVSAAAPTTVQDLTTKVLPDGNGYIKFNAFTDSTAKEFVTMYNSVVASTPGIVIDLRDCPGGSMDSALQIAHAIDANAPFGSVVIRDNHGTYDKSQGFKVKSEPLTTTDTTDDLLPAVKGTGHMVVLVNEGTANVAELMASFLRVSVGAGIVGDTTFGDGTAQTLFPEPDGSAFILTTGIVKTGTNYEFETKGIKPDIALAQDVTDSPAAITRAEQLLGPQATSALAGTPNVQGQKS